MTLLWCYIVPITFLALHNSLSAFTILFYSRKKYLNDLIELLLKASEKKVSKKIDTILIPQFPLLILQLSLHLLFHPSSSLLLLPLNLNFYPFFIINQEFS